MSEAAVVGELNAKQRKIPKPKRFLSVNHLRCPIVTPVQAYRDEVALFRAK